MLVKLVSFITKKLFFRNNETNELISHHLFQINKIQSLQRRLIARKEDLVDRELSLQEKDKLLAELRQNLARQPGVDVIDEAR